MSDEIRIIRGGKVGAEPIQMEALTMQISEGVAKGLAIGIVTAVKEILSSKEVAIFTEELITARAVNDMLHGLTAHSGRQAMDARLIKQNAIEISKIVQETFDKFKKDKSARNSEVHDEELIDAETEYRAFQEKSRKGQDDT